MNYFSLRTLIDDILLIVRNNNISESEDLSRDQIASWIIQYKTYLQKKKEEQDKENDENEPDDSLQSTVGPIELIVDKTEKNIDCEDCCCDIIKRTKDKIYTVNKSADDIVSVCDKNGCVIQYMHKLRKHYHNFRRYTYAEPVCWFDDGYIYVEGDVDSINSVYITGYIDESKTADTEDDVTIPGWMIPDIKKAILTNELAFMIKRPSDDSNNSTLASVKPNGPQDKEE